jgi:predicted peroxiredoxin
MVGKIAAFKMTKLDKNPIKIGMDLSKGCFVRMKGCFIFTKRRFRKIKQPLVRMLRRNILAEESIVSATRTFG